MKKQKIIVFDLEGTLSNHDHRLHLLKNGDYSGYNNYFELDKPHEGMVDTLIGWYEKGYLIYIVTAKSGKYADGINNWLNKNDIYQYIHCLVCRSKDDNRRSVEVKKTIFEEILKTKIIHMSYDDRKENIEMMEMIGVPATLCCKSTEQCKTPGNILLNAAETFEKKNIEYGDAYLRHGQIMSAFFPNGITLKTADDFFKYHLFELDVIKSNRLASSKFNHQDSWHDKVVYAAMGECSINKEKNNE